MTLLRVKKLGKAYVKYASEWRRLASWLGFSCGLTDEQWVLRNISFDVFAGDSIGIIGCNGVGKSTLLKMIAGTLEPTEGRIEVKGRVAAILELGMGFNPELTGRENIFYVSGLMGVSLKEIKDSIDNIEQFTEIGEYFDQPMRTYSSGMQMRVAFSLSVAFSPDILIIDEALSVGDAYFQRKCFARIEEFKKSGGTLIFVSHDINAVKLLCNRALLIDSGKLIGNGDPKDIVDIYNGLITKKTDLSDQDIVFKNNNIEEALWSKSTSIVTNGDVELYDFKILDRQHKQLLYIESEMDVILKYIVKASVTLEEPAFGIIIRDRLGRSVFEVSTYAMNKKVQPIVLNTAVEVSFNVNFNLIAGMYSFSIGVANKGYGRNDFEQVSLLMHDVEQIQVVESPGVSFYGGVYNMNPDVNINLIDDIGKDSGSHYAR